MGKIIFYLKNPSRILLFFLNRIGVCIPDKKFLLLKYRLRMGKPLNLNNPQLFNEKLQWLKLYDRKSVYTSMVDKIEAKKWVADRIGSEYIIPTIGSWNNAEDIDFDLLPNQFVLKTNHDSGTVIICKDKSHLDKKSVVKTLNRSLHKNFYTRNREWPYKNVPRKIFAEKYMVDESGYELKDYKIFCFNGKPEFIQVDFDRFAVTGHMRNLYSPDWELLDVEYIYPSDHRKEIEKPANLNEMLQCASNLSKGYPFLRIDFYSIKGMSIFGEITFYPEAGFGNFIPEEWSLKLGRLLVLPEKNGE